jgi:hypothetical protein
MSGYDERSVGKHRKVPLPINEGCFMKHVSPAGDITVWKLLNMKHKGHPNHCEIQLLSSTTKARHMEIGETTVYQRDILRSYDLWNLISEDEAAFVILGGLE